MVNIIKGGCVIRHSANLRGLLDYARHAAPVAVYFAPVGQGQGKGGTALVHFKDGATCRVNFASYQIMLDWFDQRRAFKDAKFNGVGP